MLSINHIFLTYSLFSICDYIRKFNIKESFMMFSPTKQLQAFVFVNKATPATIQEKQCTTINERSYGKRHNNTNIKLWMTLTVNNTSAY